ncbi:unnamed protein product [Soboliphyme baturini]|uniref:MRP-S28 domain-containing protein n=1 Tax=Soboliphyme baturini TaxID=241478 RepID=A0A183IPJ3_9BILA|nr:unnamed protein product [Soboliphyme baturini]
MPPRAERMPIDQDWPSVWPTAQSFKESVVPLPVRMGFQKAASKKAIPSKHANLELMKIPNFLHLTPAAIKRHCEAIKRFCTPWPEQLDTDDACRKHFPLELEYSDFCHSGPTLRDPRSRIVAMRLKLESLPLNYHARDKIIRLLQDRYNKHDGMITIVTDRCPARHQNISYALYLISVLFHESWKTESWEHDKTEDDMEKFFWQGSKSQKSIIEVVKRMKAVQNASSTEAVTDSSMDSPPKSKRNFPEYLENLLSAPSDKDVISLQVVQDYYKAWDRYRNETESEKNLTAYGKCVRKILGFPELVS